MRRPLTEYLRKLLTCLKKGWKGGKGQAVLGEEAQEQEASLAEGIRKEETRDESEGVGEGEGLSEVGPEVEAGDPLKRGEAVVLPPAFSDPGVEGAREKGVVS